MEVARKPGFKITYQGKDVTADLAPYVRDISYTDRLTGQSDELDVTLADVDGRWHQGWYPPKGAEIKYEYGYAHKPLVKAGAFCIDEVELSGPPDTVRIRALAVGLQRQARTRIGKAYENTTLKAIAETIAKRLKAKLVGSLPNIPIPKATQYGETDWAFLVRLSREYGYEVKLTNNNQTLALVKLSDGGTVVRKIRKSDVKGYRYRDKITEVPAKTEVKHYDPRKKKTVKGQAKAKGKQTASDTRHRTVPAKTPAQAKAIAEAEQERHEVDKTALELDLEGDEALASGVVIEVIEWGAVNGEYMIIEARHSAGSSGYVLSIQLKRIKELS
jgi:uncharacterized protein